MVGLRTVRRAVVRVRAVVHRVVVGAILAAAVILAEAARVAVGKLKGGNIE